MTKDEMLTVQFADVVPELASEYLYGHVNDDQDDARLNAEHLAAMLYKNVRQRLAKDETPYFKHKGRSWFPVNNDTPYESLEEMKRWYHRPPLPMVVSDLHHEHPVFDRTINLRFRIWHDTAHLETGLGFTPEEEVRLFRVQARELTTHQRYALFSESLYQLAAYVHLGEYPDEQHVRTPGPTAVKLLAAWGLS